MINMAGCAYDDGFHSDEIILGGRHTSRVSH
jgi:hypothetical protein